MRATFLLEFNPLNFSVSTARVEKAQTVCILFPWTSHKKFLTLISKLLLGEYIRCGRGYQIIFILGNAFINDLRDFGQIDKICLMPSLMRNHILKLIENYKTLWCHFEKPKNPVWTIHQDFVLVWVHSNRNSEGSRLKLYFILNDYLKARTDVLVLL